MSGKSAAQKRNENKQLLVEFKGICPEWKHKDLEALIKKEKGNKDKIGEQITIWWEEPAVVVEEWEDVSKKAPKKMLQQRDDRKFQTRDGPNANFRGERRDRDGTGNRDTRDGHAGGRGFSRGDRGGRGYGRGSAGGRGGGLDGRRTRGRGEGDDASKPVSPPASVTATTGTAISAELPFDKKDVTPVAVPVAAVPVAAVAVATPVSVTARPLMGAWGARAAAATAPPPAHQPVAPEPFVEEIPVAAAPVVEETPLEVQPPEATSAPVEVVEDDIVVVSVQDPTPAGIDIILPASKAKTVSAPAGGNVWATKGSAHLIRAEKKPLASAPPAAAVEDFVEDTTSYSVSVDDPLLGPDDLNVPVEAADQLQWADSSGVGPVSVDSPLLEPVPVPVAPIVEEREPVVMVVVPEPAPAPVETASLKTTSVLNMGHWETGEGEESVSHDFGFGFDNDHASVDETNAPVQESVSVANTVSPARPPPGLSMVGMPPMPEKIVSVSELENKLDNASLKHAQEEMTEPKNAQENAGLPNNFNAVPHNVAPVATGPPEGFAQMHQPGLQQNYAASQYGMPMYGYNASTAGVGVGAPNGFMGAGAPLGVGVPPQQKQQNLGQQQQGSIYGAPVAAQTNDNNNDANNNPANAGMPPGMAGMPHYSPAFMYGQQPYMNAQPYGFAGYGHGVAGQYGQAGFGYQQVMGQGAGYGQHYEDQGQHHGGNTHQGGYNNKSTGGGGGGYRGRNNHQQQQNQYQNQYNPQNHGGYGGQPYNMGYNDHFNQHQRGGYGQQPMDPYMQNSGGYHQETEHVKGNKNKGNNRSNYGNNTQNMQHQYQQGGQFGGVQGGAGAGAAGASDNSNPTFQGWGGGGL
jgi:hypothetical protein